MRRTGWITAGLFLASAAVAQASSPGRVLIDPESLAADAPWTDRLALALALSDTTAAWQTLDAAPPDDVLVWWSKARLRWAQGDAAQAWDAIERAARGWPVQCANEPAEVSRQFDRDRLQLALVTGSAEPAATVMASPVALHGEDAAWLALRGEAALAAGDAAQAVELLDEAWSAGDGWQRRHPAFGHRALAHLATGDAEATASAWFDYAEGVVWPYERRAAVAHWDAEPALREAVERDGFRLRMVAWLARILRRDEAYEVARGGWLRSADAEEAAACYVAAAEQLYRLRRHDDLQVLLAEPRPEGLDREQQAALDAYPWGVKRRSETGAEIATGFDEVTRAYDGTDRAAEALWEAAWMWELDENLDAATSRFRRYAQEHPRGPFAGSAALRAVLLPYRAGRPGQAAETFTSLRGALGDGMNEAAGLWIASRIAAAQDRDAASRSLVDELAQKHPGNPFLSPPPYPLARVDAGATCDLDDLVEGLHRRQTAALDRIAGELGIESLEADTPELIAAERLLELGLHWEGDGLLNAAAASDRADSGLQLKALAVAWRQGRPERQARIAFLLDRRLAGQSASLDRALWTVSHPTPFARAVLQASGQQGLPPALIWSLMRRESFYDAEVVSLAGAHGLMQLLPSTAARMAASLGDAEPAPRDLHRPPVNLRYGTVYLAQLLAESDGDVYQALASYNAGEWNGRRWAQRRDPAAPPAETILWISYSETRAYVYYVLKSWQLYRLTYDALACADAAASR